MTTMRKPTPSSGAVSTGKVAASPLESGGHSYAENRPYTSPAPGIRRHLHKAHRGSSRGVFDGAIRYKRRGAGLPLGLRSGLMRGT